MSVLRKIEAIPSVEEDVSEWDPERVEHGEGGDDELDGVLSGADEVREGLSRVAQAAQVLRQPQPRRQHGQRRARPVAGRRARAVVRRHQPLVVDGGRAGAARRERFIFISYSF